MNKKIPNIQNKLHDRKSYTNNISCEKKELLENGRFLEYYEKFGEGSYSEQLKYIQKKDIERELGIKIHFYNMPLLASKNSFKVLKIKFFKSVISFSYYLLLGILGMQTTGSVVTIGNEIIYELNIKEYNKEIEQYAEYIRSLNLSDFEIAIKVMKDIHSNIKEYKEEPTVLDDHGIYRLALYENGYGVCRNIADDYTARINAINPSLNATNLIVSVKNKDSLNNPIYELLGNHMVTCITTSDGVNLIIDSTNEKIGVLKDGRIYFFFKTSYDIDFPILNQSVMSFEYSINACEKVLKSFFTDGTYEELMEEYGTVSQNQVLENIENLDTSHYRTKH